MTFQFVSKPRKTPNKNLGIIMKREQKIPFSNLEALASTPMILEAPLALAPSATFSVHIHVMFLLSF